MSRQSVGLTTNNKRIYRLIRHPRALLKPINCNILFRWKTISIQVRVTHWPAKNVYTLVIMGMNFGQFAIVGLMSIYVC